MRQLTDPHGCVDFASFSLAKGASEILHVSLSAEGKGLLHKAGKQGLPVSLSGSGIRSRVLTLKGPK